MDVWPVAVSRGDAHAERYRVSGVGHNGTNIPERGVSWFDRSSGDDDGPGPGPGPGPSSGTRAYGFLATG